MSRPTHYLVLPGHLNLLQASKYWYGVLRRRPGVGVQPFYPIDIRLVCKRVDESGVMSTYQQRQIEATLDIGNNALKTTRVKSSKGEVDLLNKL